MIGSKFKQNYKTIIGVTLLAFFLWLMVKMNQVYDYAIDIAIRYTNIDPDKILKYPQVDTVRVEFTGKGKDLIRLHFYHLYYQIDLSHAPLHLELDLTEHHEYVSSVGLNVKVKSIVRPRLLVIELDKKVTRKLPVVVKYKLDTPPGYLLMGVKAEPDSVEVTGPAEMFKKIKAIETETKEFKDVDQPLTEEFKIRQTTEYYSFIRPKKIKVFFDVQRLAEKNIPDVPVEVINVPPNLAVVPLPSTAVLYVKGGEKVLANLTAKDFRIVIDFKRLWRPIKGKVKADLITRANVLYMESHPPEFELIVRKKSK